MFEREVFGLVLAGGKSLRMGHDKGGLIFPKLSPLKQRDRHYQTLRSCGLEAYVSARRGQFPGPDLPQIEDHPDLDGGPGVGLLSAHLSLPHAAWLVIACDFPFVEKEDIEHLLSFRSKDALSVAYQNEGGMIEPLLALWEPEALRQFHFFFLKGEKSPRHFLQRSKTVCVRPRKEKTLVNINSFEDATKHPELL